MEFGAGAADGVGAAVGAEADAGVQLLVRAEVAPGSGLGHEAGEGVARSALPWIDRADLRGPRPGVGAVLEEVPVGRKRAAPELAVGWCTPRCRLMCLCCPYIRTLGGSPIWILDSA